MSGVATVAVVPVGTATVAVVTGVATVTVAASVGIGSVDGGTVATRRIEVDGVAVGGLTDACVAAPATACVEATDGFDVALSLALD